MSQDAEHGSDSGASSGDDEEDQEAKAARQGKKAKAGKSSAEADAVRKAVQQAQAQSQQKKTKKNRKRPREAGLHEDGADLEAELDNMGKVFVSDGPMAVTHQDNMEGSGHTRMQAGGGSVFLCCSLLPAVMCCSSVHS